MPRQIRIWLRNALIAGCALGVGLFGRQAVTADVPGRDRSIDVCGFVRPETIARLLPDASKAQAEIDPTKSWCDFSGWVGEGDGRAEVHLWFGYVRSTRSRGASAEDWARYEVRGGSCINCRMKPTPVRIGDESFEYGWTYEDVRQFAQVHVRIGTVTVEAHLDTPYAARDVMFEATRIVAQEVAARCYARC
ncbi:hypothetical protein OG799_14485 [Micromonospora sp. NBC_00898]|uniref:hypothetical protein n=1 Tax=Micromonospora sp. NBC_00898 TaxID=2975981 RepID=UPI00386DE91B|nr:hypothetical protein OG799_14485 [Micromonospora sp. NBC_00898]